MKTFIERRELVLDRLRCDDIGRQERCHSCEPNTLIGMNGDLFGHGSVKTNAPDVHKRRVGEEFKIDRPH